MAPFAHSVIIMFSVYVISITSVSVNAETKESSKSNNNTIIWDSSLSPYSTNSPWLSASGNFAFGFYPQGSGFAVGIWIVAHTENENETTVVWTANRDDPPIFADYATLELTTKGLLLRTDHKDRDDGKLIINPSYPMSSPPAATLLDSGNLVFYGDNKSHIIWESFDFPTDTILGGQNLSTGNQLVSSMSKTNHSSGRFRLTIRYTGNLVLFSVDSENTTQEDYWVADTAGDLFEELRLYENGSLVLEENSKSKILGNGFLPHKNGTIIYRATLDVDGNFRQYSHSTLRNRSVNEAVSVLWSALENPCDAKGFCGFNSFCMVKDEDKVNGASCHCYPGFDFITKDTTRGCYQNLSKDSCMDTDPNKFKITPLIQNMSWDDNPYKVGSMKMDACKTSCLDDCNCWAVLHGATDQCRKYRLPIRNGKKNGSFTAFFKVVVSGGITPKPDPENRPFPSVSRDFPVLIIGLCLGSVALLCCVLAISGFLVYKHRVNRYNKLLENAKLGLMAEDFTLQSFSYDELERATDGFKEELGRGSFGAVYKGTLSVGMSNKAIAVKRLETVEEEGIREFRAEMISIGQTHHRNLVQLLGFCVERSNKLLVYEFMANGSLADLLFKAKKRPNWKERVRLILGVARGVLYLHEECGVHIIHCNLKPQNILLDDTWTAKISDFGFARLLVPSQAKIPIGVEGSTWYFAPEWQKNTLISVKADIYSLGIVILEIICCRRNIDLNVPTHDEIVLSSWVYKCFLAGELNKLVEEEANEADHVEMRTLERMVKVGLWCIQEDPALRPLMKNVILMLEGTMDIPVPLPPEIPPSFRQSV